MFSTGELARRLGTTLRTVRFYEEAGLLLPGRDAAGRRQYGEGDVKRLRLISDLRELDLSIGEIRELLSLRAGVTAAPELAGRLGTILTEQLARARRRLEAVARLEEEFSGTLALLEHCKSCRKPLADAPCPACSVGKAAPRLMQVVLDAGEPAVEEAGSERPAVAARASGAGRRRR